MKIINSILAIVFTLLIVGCSGGTSDNTENSSAVSDDTSTQSQNTSTTTSSPYPAPVLTDDMKAEYLKAINDARNVSQDCGTEGSFSAVSALIWNDSLYSAAFEHSNDMAESNTFSHNGSGTNSDWTGVELGKQSTSKERIENNAYADWNRIGENIAAGQMYTTAEEVVKGWLASDGHCANIMNPDFNELGMAKMEKSGTTYDIYWTQNFGRR